MCRIKTRIQNILQDVKEKLQIQTNEQTYRQYVLSHCHIDSNHWILPISINCNTQRKHTEYFRYQKTNHILTLFHVSS